MNGQAMNRKLKKSTKQIRRNIKRMYYSDYYDMFFDLPTQDLEKLYGFLSCRKENAGKKFSNPVSSIPRVIGVFWNEWKLDKDLLSELNLILIDKQEFSEFCKKHSNAIDFFRHLAKMALYTALDIDFFGMVTAFGTPKKLNGKKKIYRVHNEIEPALDDLNKLSDEEANEQGGETPKVPGDAKNELEYYDLAKKYGEDSKFVFRGQSDYSWDVLPSMFRNFPESGKGNFLMDLDGLYRAYELAKGGKLVRKYNECFPDRRISIKTRAGIDYRFLSFMQHSVCYSPLLDFTEDYRVSSSFATASEKRTSAAVFIYDFSTFQKPIKKEREFNEHFKNLNVAIFNEKILPGSTAEAKNVLRKAKCYNFETSCYR